MSGAILVSLLVLLMLGPLVVILTVGYLNTEAEREKKAAEEAAQAGLELPRAPRFMASPAEAPARLLKPTVGDAMVAEIQAYLAKELAAVDAFVTEPSVERLHHSSRRLKITKAILN